MSKLQMKAVKKHGRDMTRDMVLSTKVIKHKHRVEPRKTTKGWLKEANCER